MRTCYVYRLTNANHTVLYIGVTNDLARRVAEHKASTNVHKLVHFETYQVITDAIAREKQLKAGSRAKKLALINAGNPAWEELAG